MRRPRASAAVTNAARRPPESRDQILRSSEFEADPRRALAEPFVEKSVSPATRKAYKRAIREFFAATRVAHPADVTPDHVRLWRDRLTSRGLRPATVIQKLSVIRSFFDYLVQAGHVARNPAGSKIVPPPARGTVLAGRSLEPREVRYLLAGPNRATPEGARDYALLLLLARTGIRAAEACSLRASSIRRRKYERGEWALVFTVKGGREDARALPTDVKLAVDAYLALDARRRRLQHSADGDPYVFQPLVNYRTGEFAKPLSTRMLGYVVGRWGEYAGLGKVTPHDLRRTAITRALDLGASYREVQAMSGHRDPRDVMRYDHGRTSLDVSAANLLSYDE